MTKAKESAAGPFGATMYFGADALAGGFEKSAALCNTIQGFSKDNAEAYMESAVIAGESVQSINKEIYAFSKKATSDSIDVAKALMATKSIPELVDLQSKFAKNAFDSYVGQVTKLSELFGTLTKKSFAPLESRAHAIGDLISQSVHI